MALNGVSLAYLPRNVAPVIDGHRPSRTRYSRASLRTGVGVSQPTVVTLEAAAVAEHHGCDYHARVVPPLDSNCRRKAPCKKGYQSVLWSAHDDNDDELRYAVYFRGEKRTRMETIEGQSRAKILFLGYHHAAGWRLLPEKL